MDDLISRQAAIDEIDEWIKAFRENGHKESAADARLIRNGTIQLPSAERWIPVSDRLPESSPDDLEYPTVLGSFSDGSVQLVCYYESTKEWGGGEYFDMKRFPVAWMPLPKPYEGGKE